MKKYYLILMVIFLLPLSLSCGGGGSSSGGSSSGSGTSSNAQTISYDMSNSNDWVKCNNASNVLTSTTAGNRQTDCYWYCGSGYKNANNSWVVIFFMNKGSGWYIFSDGVQKGVCN